MKKVFFIVVLGLVLSGCTSGNTYWSYGVGNNTCADWLEVRETKRTELKAAEFNSWIAGWVSGAGSVNVRELRHINIEVIESWTVNYCTKNPYALVKDATKELTEYLEKDYSDDDGWLSTLFFLWILERIIVNLE